MKANWLRLAVKRQIRKIFAVDPSVAGQNGVALGKRESSNVEI